MKDVWVAISCPSRFTAEDSTKKFYKGATGMRKTVILLLLTVCLLICSTIPPVFANSPMPLLPEIEADSYILINAADNRVLSEKDPDKKLYPASTTKIMTAIIALESGYYDQTTTVSKAAVDGIGINGSNVALKEGEIIQYKDLLRMTLISSGNDAANVLAEGVGGSIPDFVALMDQKVKELGLSNTHLSNPSGLDVEDGYPEHQTTARDLAQIMRYATSNHIFREIIGETEYTLPVTNFHPEVRGSRKSTDLLLTQPKYQSDNFTVVGGKTGYTKAAQNVFAACARNGEGVELILVLMKHPSRNRMFEDAYELFEYGFELVRQDSSLQSVGFYDIRYRESADIIHQFYESGYINGNEEGRFDYAGNVTREEFLQVLGGVRGSVAAASGNDPAQSCLNAAIDQGILDESWRGTGNTPMTRGDAITIMSRHIASRLDVFELLTYMIKIKDLHTVPVSSRWDVLRVYKTGIITVSDEGTIGFDDLISKEEMVLILDRYARYRDTALSTILAIAGHISPIRAVALSFCSP